MPDPVNGGTGDPYITTLFGTEFPFAGDDNKVYNLFTDGGLQVLTRVSPVMDGAEKKSYISGTDVIIGKGTADEVWIVAMSNGVTWVHYHGHRVEIQTKACTLDAPGHLGVTTDEAHPLLGVAHQNLHFQRPPHYDGKGATGLVIDGNRPDAKDADYEVTL